MRKKLCGILAFLSAVYANAYCAYAVTINPNTSIADDQFKSMEVDKVPSLILGTTFWILRLAGVIILISGIYKLTASRKDGDAEEINGAMLRCIVAACFIALPKIMKALHLVN